MAISVVGTPQSGVKTDGTDVTLSPGACVKGDILIVWGGTYNRAGITPGPTANLSNFTTWTNLYRYTAGNPLFDVSWCRCTADNTPSVTCKGSGNAADGVIYCCYVLRGVNPTLLSAAGAATGWASAGPTTSTNPDSPSASCAGVPSTRSQWVLSLVISSVRDTAVTVPSTPGTFVNKVGNDANSTNDYTCYGATYDMGTGTSVDPGAWTAWVSSTWLSATLVVSPALEGAGGNTPIGVSGPAYPRALLTVQEPTLAVQSLSEPTLLGRVTPADLPGVQSGSEPTLLVSATPSDQTVVQAETSGCDLDITDKEAGGVTPDPYEATELGGVPLLCVGEPTLLVAVEGVD